MSKRFTDAELAAEVWQARYITRVRHARIQNYRGEAHLHDHYEEGLREECAFERFARVPHYNEDTR